VNAAARAGVTLAAVAVSCAATAALCRWAGAQSQPVIVAGVLAVALARRERTGHIGNVAAGILRLATIAVVASGVGFAMHAFPIPGAAAFVVLLSATIWLRNFGARGRAIGALATLPLVALLVVPGGPAHARGGPLVDLALVVAAGCIAYVVVSAFAFVRLRADDADAPFAGAAAAPGVDRARRPGPTVSTRMALQMLVALGTAFAIGFAVFPSHVGWTVLTAFIVCVGARGRGDALYRAILRLAGALGGTIVAVGLAHLWRPGGLAEVAVIFLALFLGLWLRERNYAYWAAAMTVIFALLAGSGSAFGVEAFAERLEAILAGAVCGVAAAWFVTPIRTVDVIRRRLADALVAFDEVVAHAHLADDDRAARIARFEHHLGELDRLAVPVRWHRRAFAFRAQPDHPAKWIDLANDLRPHAGTLADHPNRAAIRRAVGISRRAIAQHGAADAPPERVPIGDALAAVHETLRREAP
jgi:hypothetical protein